MAVDFGDLPTWVASIGTAGALGTALYQIGAERKLRRAGEVRAEGERRRSQARLVSARPGKAVKDDSEYAGGYTPLYIVKSSPEPVYGLVLCIVSIQGAAPHTIEDMLENRVGSKSGSERRDAPVTTLNILPLGRYRTSVRGVGWDGYLAGRNGVDIAFSDRAGIHWVRQALGALEELAEPPLSAFGKFGLYGSYELKQPEPVA